MDKLMELIERLEKAPDGSRATWCTTCGRVNLSVPRQHVAPGKSRHITLAAGTAGECEGLIDSGTPEECIAALKARRS